MIIGIDAGCLSVSDQRLKVGVYQMAYSLLLALFQLDQKNEYRLYSFSPIEKKLLQLWGKNVKNIIVKPEKGWLRLWLPLELKKKPVDLFLGLSQALPNLPKQTKGIVLIHDLTFEKNPEWFKNSYHKMSLNAKSAVKRADKVIAVSKATREDLINIYQVDKVKIKVIYEGLSQRLKRIAKNKALEQLRRKGINQPFLLYVGTYKPSKNIPNIISAFSLFNQKNKGFQLVLVGSDFWLDEEIEKRIKKENLGSLVVNLGFISDEILSLCYSSAFCFISPSFNEGFGLTFLEAAHFNLPLIASNRGSIREIFKSGAFYADPHSPENICQIIETILQRPILVKKKTAVAKNQSKKFSFKTAAKQLLILIKTYEK